MHLADIATPAQEATYRLIAEIRRLNAAMNIPEKLSGIRMEDISKLTRYADKEANPLYPVPKLMDASELEQLYYDVMEESH